MNITTKNVLLVLLTAVMAGWTSFVSNFHPGVTLLAVGTVVVNALSQLVQSPLLSKQVAPVALEAKSLPNDNHPRVNPYFVKENKQGFAKLSHMIVLCICGMVAAIVLACTQQQAKTAESVALSVEQFACAEEAVTKLGGDAVATDVADACKILQPFVPAVQGLIDSQSVIRLAAVHHDAGVDAK